MPLDDIYSLSQAGCRFYRFATHQVDDNNLRRIFQQRFDIHQQLLTLAHDHGASPDAISSSQAISSVGWFNRAQEAFESFESFIFLDLLEAQEKITLEALKSDVKSADSEPLRVGLAQLAAHMQVSRDQLATLKVQYRSQRGGLS